MFTWMAKKYGSLPELRRVYINAIYAFLIFYGGAILQARVQEHYKKENIQDGVIEGIFISLMFVLFLTVATRIRKILEDESQKESIRKRYLSHAFSLLNNFVSEQIRHVRQPLNKHNTITSINVLSCLPCIQGIIQRLYQFFEAHYGESEKLDERIDFEVTFMTHSYKDGEITIPAHANREGRSPTSMREREQNPKIYEQTVTAEVYRDIRPSMRIIENTTEPESRYQELYADQKDRIRSSIVYPVVDDKNGILGTLVVHCNRTCFFKRTDEAFWRELLEMFAARLALEKSRLDIMTSDNILNELKVIIEPPF